MLSFSLIGAGFIGKVHAASVAACPNARLAVVYDIDGEAMRTLAEAHGADVARSAEDAISDDSIDAVIIAASTKAHAELARACAASGKAFLCEKPIDLNVSSATETVSIVQKSGVFAGMGFSRRHDHQHKMLKEAVDRGEVGKIEMMHFISRTQSLPRLEYIKESGGQLRDKGAHFFDLACWLSGERPVEIYAAGDCLIEPGFREYGDVDTAMVMMRLASGAYCHFGFSRRTAYGYDESIEVFGSEGKILSRAPTPSDVVRYHGNTASAVGLHQSWIGRFRNSYFGQMEAFAKSVTGETVGFPTLEAGLVAETIADAGMRSIAERVPIDINYSEF